MKLIAAITVFLLFASSGQAQQECVFDTENQKEVLTQLQKKYPGSKLNTNENTLEIKWDKGIIRYQRGGCNHFGERIKYVTSENTDFASKYILFDQVGKMAKAFFRDLISGDELEAILKKEKYSTSKAGAADIYAICHDQVIDLAIIYSLTGQSHTIEIGYYIN